MQLLKDLQASKAKMLTRFDLPESDLQKKYAPGKWTIRELLHHITDAETVMYDRVRRIISEQPNPVIWAFDQDNWATQLNYQTFPLVINKNIFLSVRASVEYLVKEHYEKNGHLPFVHSQTGARTLKDEFDKIAWHSEHHLAQIELALKKDIY